VSTEQTGDAVSDQTADALPGDTDNGEVDRTSNTDPETIERIAGRARRIVRGRIRALLDGPATADPGLPELDPEQLDRIADEEAQRAVADSGRAVGALLQVAVVHAVSEELGIEIEDALEHPAVGLTRARLSADDSATPDSGEQATPDAGDRTPRVRPPRQRALLLDAVHVFGIETLTPGDADIELRLADAGIDVRKPSTAEMIGRLRWSEVRSVSVQRPRRGLPGRRRPALFVAGTDRGEVTFELPGVSDDEITEHLEPLIARNCAGYSDSNAV
jgi:hypothetical protein